MRYDRDNRTFDCDPTLNDSQVLEFCREGYLMLPGAVPDEINERTCQYLNREIPVNPSWMPEGLTIAEVERMRETHEPSGILLEDWFVEHVLLNPALAGIMRSLLGAHTGLPVIVSNHRVECPAEAQRWHHDADRVFGPELEFAEVFYFPQDTPPELGPTEIAPRTHISRSDGDFTGEGVLAGGPAGTLGIHHQSILHRRGASTASGLRHMLNTTTGAPRPPAATGSRIRSPTRAPPGTAATPTASTWPTCSGGCRARGTSTASSGARAGPSAPPTRSARPTGTGGPPATGRTGAGTRTGTRAEAVFYGCSLGFTQPSCRSVV